MKKNYSWCTHTYSNFKSWLSLKKKRVFRAWILLWPNCQGSQSSLCSGFFPAYVLPSASLTQQAIYVLLMDTGGGGTHKDSPIGNVFPKAGCGPRDRKGLGDAPHHNGDSPHHAVVGARAHRDPLLPSWEVFEVLDVRVKVLRWGPVGRGQEHPWFCTPHLHRQPQRGVCTDLHQSTALGGQVKYP